MGVIVSVGPVHLELLGTLEAIAAAKAELIAALAPGGTAIVPAREPLLAPHLRADLTTVTFGEGGDVRLRRSEDDDRRDRSRRPQRSCSRCRSRRLICAATCWPRWPPRRGRGARRGGRVELALSAGRGQHVELPDGVTLIDDCYNANPMSMRAALDDLSQTAGRRPPPAAWRCSATCSSSGPASATSTSSSARRPRAAGVELLVTVGPLAAAMAERFEGEVRSVPDAAEAAELVPGLLRPGDVVLVKGSRGVGLELVCRALRASIPANGAGVRV